MTDKDSLAIAIRAIEHMRAMAGNPDDAVDACRLIVALADGALSRIKSVDGVPLGPDPAARALEIAITALMAYYGIADRAFAKIEALVPDMVVK